MKTYSVTLPVSGVVHIDVEAESREEAIETALQTYKTEHLDEWEACKQIVRGNVFYGHTNEAEAQEISE